MKGKIRFKMSKMLHGKDCEIIHNLFVLHKNWYSTLGYLLNFSLVMPVLRIKQSIGANKSLVIKFCILFVFYEALAWADGNDIKREGAQIFASSCAICHGSSGEGKVIGSRRFPAIAGLQRWYIQDQLIKFKYDGRGANPNDQEGLMMHAMVRFLKTKIGRNKNSQLLEESDVDEDFSEPDIWLVAEYISNLKEDSTHKFTIADKLDNIEESVARGERIYNAAGVQGCVRCHGAPSEKFKGRNREDLNQLLPRAPKLSPLDDWYMLNQLEKFRRGTRGAAAGTMTAKRFLNKVRSKILRHPNENHPADKLDGAALMQAMSQTALKDEKDMLDVVSYIYSITHPEK